MRSKTKVLESLSALWILFIAISPIQGWAHPPLSAQEAASVSISVELREWFILEVRTPEAVVESAGSSGASVTAMMSPDGLPSQVRAFASVGKSQAVELRVQVFGDPADSEGKTLPLSEVFWEGSGQGFLSGRFASSGTAVLARWMGAGYHEGTVRYLYPKNKPSKKGCVQRVVYSLMAT